MLPPSTKQLMQQSLPFKFAFTTSILLMITVTVLGIVSTSVTCRNYYEYRSCYEASSYYYYQCNNGVTYCCTSYYSYCGDYYCQTLRTACMGIFIAMWICSTICFFLSIITFVLFRNFRRKAIQQYQIFSTTNQYVNSSGQLPYVHPIVFPNPNQPAVLRINQTEYSEYNRRLVE